MIRKPHTHTDLIPHWLLCAGMLLLLISYNVVCQIWSAEIRITYDEPHRVLIRSILYAVTIVLFPLVKLIRHILLRLNQTMPGEMPANQRYLVTIALTLPLIETVGLFGFIMFVLGDDFNTLYIFSLLAALGIFLHKPNLNEYSSICAALEDKIADQYK